MGNRLVVAVDMMRMLNPFPFLFRYPVELG